MALLEAGEKVRNVLCLIYLEDIPSYGELLSFLESLQIPCACSCVHDKDTFTSGDVAKFVRDRIDKETGQLDESKLQGGIPKEGQHKKPHIHVLFRFPGPVTREAVSKLLEPFVYIEPWRIAKCISPDASLRYFGHLDSPEKHFYGSLSVKGFGGIDMSALLKTSKVNNISTLLDVLDAVKKRGIKSYYQLVDWSITTADFDTICCVAGRASFFSNYFASMPKPKKKEEN